MATLKTANQKGKYHDFDAKKDTISYILNPYKAIHGYVGGVGVCAECPSESMEIISEQFGKAQGVQVRHYIVSFAPDELRDPEIACKIAQEISCYIGRKYQVIYAVHENTPHLHIHLIANTVSYIDGNRWGGTYAEFFPLKNTMSAILRKYNINLQYVSSCSKA